MSSARAQGRRPLVAVLVGAMVGVAPMLAAIGGLGGVATRNAGNSPGVTNLSEDPLLSVRRINATLSNDVAVSALRGELQGFADSIGDTSCLTVTAQERKVISSNGAAELIPASNTKILTALVALDVLGPDYKFETKIVGEVVNGVAEGSLYIVGGGDPVLSLPNYPATEQYPTFFLTDVTALLDQVVAAGVKRIKGSLVGDGTLFDDQRFPSGWADDIRYAYGGPFGALLLDDGNVFGLPQKLDDPALAASQELGRHQRMRPRLPVLVPPPSVTSLRKC